jgi:hypothetical protein
MSDLNKFKSPAMSGEVTEGLISVRLSMHALLAMIMETRAGNAASFDAAFKRYLDLDSELQKIINRVGGLDGPK